MSGSGVFPVRFSYLQRGWEGPSKRKIPRLPDANFWERNGSRGQAYGARQQQTQKEVWFRARLNRMRRDSIGSISNRRQRPKWCLLATKWACLSDRLKTVKDAAFIAIVIADSVASFGVAAHQKPASFCQS